MNPPEVGVIGIGMIGTVVVDGLLAAGRHPVVFDRDAEAVGRAVRRGAHEASSLAELTGRCAIVVICVVSADQVYDVVGEIVAATASGAERPIVVVHSTVGPEAISEVVRRASGLRVIDAPVSDNRGVDAHRLFAFLGTPGKLPAEVAAAFDSYCHGFQVVGDVGSGQLLKLVCNMISLITSSAVTEALALCTGYGIDPEVAAEVAMHGSASSWVLANWAKLSPRAAIVRKDLAAAVDAAERVGVAMPVATAARDASDVLFAGRPGGLFIDRPVE